jgi:hypothetical protein
VGLLLGWSIRLNGYVDALPCHFVANHLAYPLDAGGLSISMYLDSKSREPLRAPIGSSIGEYYPRSAGWVGGRLLSHIAWKDGS